MVTNVADGLTAQIGAGVTVELGALTIGLVESAAFIVESVADAAHEVSLAYPEADSNVASAPCARMRDAGMLVEENGSSDSRTRVKTGNGSCCDSGGATDAHDTAVSAVSAAANAAADANAAEEADDRDGDAAGVDDD